jgi:CBS domain-containing protein
MTTVKSVIEKKGSRVVTVLPTATVGAATRLLSEQKIGAVVVSADGATPQGIFSERDLVRQLTEHGPSVLHKPLRDVITGHVVTCEPDCDLREIMEVMTNRHLRHLPVVQDGRLVGIISIGDVVKNRLEDMMLEANVLRDYTIALR